MTALSTIKPDTPHICSHKYAFMLDNWIRKCFQRPKKMLGQYVKTGDTVIDLGCGPGFFTVDCAKLVGKTGKVLAVDLQERMLDYVKTKAEKHQVADIVTYHKCTSERIGADIKADFILAFYVVHELPDIGAFFREVKTMLKANGRLLVVEPRFHVGKAAFVETVSKAETAGLKQIARPKGLGGRGVLFTLP